MVTGQKTLRYRGVGSIGLAALITCWVVIDFFAQHHEGDVAFFNLHL
ncbi:MAG: hypothetical protein ACR5LD_03235 [Symbiopectobacterium sp.]